MTRVSDIEVVSGAVLFGFSEVAPINFYEEYEEARMMSDAKEVIRLEEEIFKFKIFRFYRGMSYDEFNKSRHEFNDYYDNLNELIGYNIKAYDFKILTITRYVLTDVTTPEEYIEAIKSLSDGIIHTQQTPFDDNRNLWKAANKIKLIDLYTLHRLDYYHVSLKQCAILLKWWRVQDYDFETVDAEEFPDVDMLEDYNKNDILITGYLFHKSKDELISRFVAEEMFGQDFRSKSRSSMADSIMSILYSQITTLEYKAFSEKRTYRRIVKLKDAIHPLIKFKTKELNEFLKTLRQTTIEIFRGDRFSAKFQLGEIIYQLGEGGIHSKDKAAKFEEDDDWFIIDADVTSYYPSMISELGFAPAHLSRDAFLMLTRYLKDIRVKFKDSGETNKATVFKIVINSGPFGKMRSDKSWLYDVLSFLQVTINGQLMQLMLAESLELSGHKVISANTDGLTCKVKKTAIDDYFAICNKWQEDTKMRLEYARYIKYIRLNVNNYIAVYHTGKVKAKGFFSQDIQFDKGYKHPIVSKAVLLYYTEGIPYEKTILEHDNILDFCIATKINAKFTPIYSTIKKGVVTTIALQKNNRFYVSTNGGSIVKQSGNSKISMLQGYLVTPLNDLTLDDISTRKINYGYYISAARVVVEEINNNITKKLKGTKKQSGISGTLFDGVEDFSRKLTIEDFYNEEDLSDENTKAFKALSEIGFEGEEDLPF